MCARSGGPDLDTILSERFQDALRFTARLHASQRRKGTKTPYLAHLMSVSAIVIENGGDEEQAIAALLHDAVEDQGGRRTLDTIRERYGERVARMVDELSDSYSIPKPPWRERKVEYLAHLPQAGKDTLLISLADKLHNARSILQDYSTEGEEIWKRFKGGKVGVLWYYRSLSDFFTGAVGGWLAAELARTIAEIERQARTGGT